MTVVNNIFILLTVAYVAGFNPGGGDNAIDDDFPNIDDMVVTTTEAPRKFLFYFISNHLLSSSSIKLVLC